MTPLQHLVVWEGHIRFLCAKVPRALGFLKELFAISIEVSLSHMSVTVALWGTRKNISR